MRRGGTGPAQSVPDLGPQCEFALCPRTIGSYTLQVRGTDNGIGEAIVEIYKVP